MRCKVQAIETCVKSTFYGATPARWRGDAGFSPLDGAPDALVDFHTGVYADMSVACEEYADDKTMLELVFAPVTPETGASRNWLAASDDEVVEATLDELRQLFPADMEKAKLRKSAVVRVPRSVYAAIPGRNKYRPSQRTPIPNLTLCGCFTSQKFLGSMEGAVLAGKLAAEVVASRAVGAPTQDLKEVQRHVVDAAATAAPKKPLGCRGDSPIAFGGGEVVAASR